MRRKLKYAYLSVLYYKMLAEEKLSFLWFTLEDLLTCRKPEKKLSGKKIAELKELLKDLMK